MYLEYQKIADKYIIGSGPYFKDINPSNGELIAELKTSTSDDLRDSVNCAVQKFEEWKSISPFKRGLMLLRSGELMEHELEDYARLITLEEGKTIKDSRLEVIRSFNTLKFYGVMAMNYGGKTLPSANDKTSILTTKEPLGTVALITPWNFPLSIPVWKMAPALAAGNTVLIKPASKTPLIVAKLLETLEKAGFPKDVVRLVVGSGKTIGDQLVRDERIKAISFTGSVPVGKSIYKSVGDKGSMTRIQLELGGKNAIYVDEFSDLSTAVSNTVVSAFGLTGQSCTATSRLLVHTKVYDEFRKKLSSALKNWKTGDGMAPDTDMGPVVDETQLKIDIEYIESAINEGATMFVGDEKIEKKGLFLNPFIFEDVSKDMRIFNEEIFGPVLAMTKVENLDEAIDLVNSVDYGHTSGIMTTNISNAMEYVRRVDVGVIKINKPTVGLELQAPFGAFKNSGANTWKEMGEEAMDFYSKEKTTYLGW
ncbi:MAG: aldehyde dehydrogenase family protein [Candidatus Micrarchaeaceae archaeon]